MSKPAYWKGGDIPWLTAKDLKSFELSDSQMKITAEGAKAGSRIAPTGSVLMLVRGMTLFKDVPLGIATRPLAFGQDLKALEPHKGVLGRFLAWRLRAAKHHLMQLVDTAGHGTGRLSTELLASLPVLLPDPEEQAAIVEILDCAEAAERTADALIELKAGYKKALAQDLLTGRRRFPGFPTPWRETKLIEAFTEVKQLNSDGQIELVITVGKNAIRPQTEHFNRVVASATRTDYNIINPGQFVYDPMSAYYGAMGQYQLAQPGIVSPVYRVLDVKSGFDRDFLRHLMKSGLFESLVTRASTQGNKDGKRRGLQREAFLAIKLPIPDTDEQRWIAGLLGAIDAEIALLSKQRDALNEQKKGLMQKLLTGEVRLKEFR